MHFKNDIGSGAALTQAKMTPGSPPSLWALLGHVV